MHFYLNDSTKKNIKQKKAPGNWVIETNWKSRLGVYGDKEAKVDPKYFVTAVKGLLKILYTVCHVVI